jgi:hypothetical protein
MAIADRTQAVEDGIVDEPARYSASISARTCTALAPIALKP